MENLLQLQNLIKRDKDSYAQEFIVQYNHYKSLKDLFQLNPDKDSKEFRDLVSFISHLANYFPSETNEFPRQIMKLLQEHFMNMCSSTRLSLVQALILMRNRKLLMLSDLLELFFTLYKAKDKSLRNLITQHIISDLKNANSKAKDLKLNKSIQNYMWKVLEENSAGDIGAKKALDIMIQLYKKGVWNDAKTVNIIAQATFSKVQKVASTSLGFFLNDDLKEEEDDDPVDISKLKHSNSCNKKTKSRQKQMGRVLAGIKRKERAKGRAESFNFSALHLINDPQGFTEKLFSRLKQVHSSNEFRFEIRILYLNLISRMIGLHKLFLLNFYDFMIPYVKPQQKEITSLLAFLAQASHELVPPDSLESVIYAIADNFVWSNCASEVITAGMNSLREICTRCPLAMPETLLQSLMEDYKNHREKGPMNAARSLLGLYREVNPELLRKRDRGKSASINMKTFTPAKYGETHVSDGVEGAELLLMKDEEAPLLVEDDSEQDSNVHDDESDIQGEYPDAELEGSHEDEDLEDTKSDDEKEDIEPVFKKQKLDISAAKILTDEDFQRIKELKLQREAEKVSGLKNSKVTLDTSDNEDNGIVDASKITSGIRRKDDYEARIEKIKAGREGRSFGSKKGSSERTSITNKVKSKKNKAFMMMVHKKDVKNKAKRSLREKQRVLRAHVKKQKMKK